MSDDARLAAEIMERCERAMDELFAFESEWRSAWRDCAREANALLVKDFKSALVELFKKHLDTDD